MKIPFANPKNAPKTELNCAKTGVLNALQEEFEIFLQTNIIIPNKNEPINNLVIFKTYGDIMPNKISPALNLPSICEIFKLLTPQRLKSVKRYFGKDAISGFNKSSPNFFTKRGLKKLLCTKNET